MTTHQIIWTRNLNRNETGEIAMIGAVIVGKVYKLEKWQARVFLPGVTTLKQFTTMKAAKDRVELLTRLWFELLDETTTGGSRQLPPA